ncbi:hypothetical protein DFR52_101158 [Hoeflea marina]|uniref:Uncharacterized protein n=1 Tax=Hoeflea marina TaxID=274592 RepID=A0A317PRA4_9HYPH|nr:hypothetical protein [Hoeflea marina]PWW03477.1 hypothetical protein DFR52_101158 [Hoeflea marina]
MLKFLVAALLALAAGPAVAGVQTSIPASATQSPKAFWAAVMEEFYGPYSTRQKCWLGTVEGKAVCMRPHRLDTVVEGGASRYYLVIGGYELQEGGGRPDCHACAGSIGLIVLGGGSSRLELVARNSLAEPAGSWGEVPGEKQFRLQRIGPAAYGWTMESGYTGQGYTGVGETVFGLVGDKVADLGFINTHSDNSGACGDGMAACYAHDYELIFDIAPGDTRFSDVIVRRLDSTDPKSPASFAVPFNRQTLSYDVPQALSDLLGI